MIHSESRTKWEMQAKLNIEQVIPVRLRVYLTTVYSHIHTADLAALQQPYIYVIYIYVMEWQAHLPAKYWSHHNQQGNHPGLQSDSSRACLNASNHAYCYCVAFTHLPTTSTIRCTFMNMQGIGCTLVLLQHPNIKEYIKEISSSVLQQFKLLFL